MKNGFLNLALVLLTTITYAQGVVTGVVIDGEFNTPLVGASVVVKESNKGISTDVKGNFSLQVTANSGTLEVSFIGFATKLVPYKLSNGKANVSVILHPDTENLTEVVVMGNSLLDIAKERQTPVAVSTIGAAEIIEKLGNKEFPEILNRTPSVYATKAGGGFGDSKINIRGFDDKNIAVMVNGMPVNDMENGRVYWSNWAGISEVASAMQVQRGLGASKLAIASVGGTINIITRTSDMKQGGSVYGGYGNNDGNHQMKITAAYNTGKSKKGWSSSILLSRNAGEKYADRTEFEGYNYFFALGYTPSDKHNFQFMITGAPQWHNQRYSSVAISDAIKFGSADKPNRKYNSDWGYLNNEPYAHSRNAYHKPVMMFNWDWKMDDYSALSTVVYASFGRGFGSGDYGSINKKRLRDFKNADTGLYEFDKIVEANRTSKTGNLVRTASVNSHDWYGFLTNFNHKIDENFTFNMGLDGRYYYGYHYRVITDLWGASSFKETKNENVVGGYQVSTTYSDKPSFNPFASVHPFENRVDYSNDGEVRWVGMFAQLEYSDDNFSAFLQGSSSIQGFQRIDEFIKPGKLAVRNNPATAMDTKTGFKDILGYNIKGGVNYNINEQHNVFANIGYYSKQPFFNAVYPNYKNFLNPNLTNEKVLGMEAGYGFKSSFANVNLNVYRTSWKDRFERKSNVLRNISGSYANILGITEIHQGIELETDVRVTDYLRFKGALSLGDWFYEGNAQGNLFNESNELIDKNGNVLPDGNAEYITLFLDKVKVGESAQKTASLGATLIPFDGFKFNADWRYVSNLYGRLNVTSFDNQAQSDKGALLLPSYNLFDLSMSYKLKITDKQLVTLTAHIDNLFDTYYIAESYDNIHATDVPKTYNNAPNSKTYEELGETYKGVSTANRVYFGFGRTWNVGIRYSF